MADRTRRRWSDRSYAAAPPEAESQRRVDARGQRAYLDSLRSRAPGQWTDNRLEQSRHQLGAVHVAIKVLSDMAAACECRVVRHLGEAREADGKKDSEPVERDHPLARLMRRPNNKETGGFLRRRWVQQLCLTGSALSWHLADGNGDPAEMWCVPTGTWQPVLSGPAYPEGAYRILPYHAYGPFALYPGLMRPGGVVVPADEVLRIDFPHPWVQYDSYSPLTAAGLQLEALEAVDRSRSYFMRQGPRPGAVVELPPETAMPDPDYLDQIKEEFASKYGGPEAAGRIAFLTGGAQFKPWGHDSAAMGYEQAWSQLVDFCLAVFGTTKILAFMAEASSYAALYASLKQFNWLSLSPLMSLMADAINAQIVWPHWGEDYSVEMRPKAIDDKDEKRQDVQLLVSVGGVTYNEAREAMGFEPTDEPWGKERAWTGQAAAAMQKSEAAAAKAGAPDAPGGDGAGGSLESLLAGLEGDGGSLDAPDDQPPGMEAAMPDPGGAGRGSLPSRRLAKAYYSAGHLNGHSGRNGHG